MSAHEHPLPDRLERALAASLKPVDPGAAFTQALEARLARAQRAVTGLKRESGPSLRQRRMHAASLALAASVIVALAVGWQLSTVREEQAQLARAQQTQIRNQVLLALEITGERLGAAQRRIEQYQSQENTL